MDNKTLRITNQTGAVLYISLIVLVLLSIIGITAMQVTSLEEKMSGNTRNSNLAFQSAETTLRAAEKALSAAALPAFDNQSGYYTYTPGATERWETVNWASTTETILYDTYLAGISKTTQPRYIVEELPPVIPLAGDDPIKDAYYQITSQAVGGTDTAQTVLQSVYKQ